MATFDIPPWLQQPADPIRSMLAGAQIGSQIAANRQRSRQLDMQVRELAAQERAQQQEMQLRGLKIAEYLRDRDDEISARASMMELSDTIGPMLKDGKFEEARNILFDATARNPAMLNFAPMTNLFKEVDAAIKQKGVQAQLDSMERLRKSQEAENVAQTEKLRMEATDLWLGEGKALGFTEMKLPSGHIILQNKATGAGIVIDPTKASVQAHLKAFSAEDSALQKQLTGIENDLLMRVNPEKKAKAIAEVQKQRATVRERYLGKMLQDQNATLAEEGSVAPAQPPPATPTIEQDKATILNDARDAIKMGKPRDKVIQRLRELGITEEP